MNPDLHIRQFSGLVQEAIHVEFPSEVFQPPERKAFRGPVRNSAKDEIQIQEIFPQVRDLKERFSIVF
jgi:hypothetical protein